MLDSSFPKSLFHMTLFINIYEDLKAYPEKKNNNPQELESEGFVFFKHNKNFSDYAPNIIESVPYSVKKTYPFRFKTSAYVKWRNELAMFSGFDDAEEVWQKAKVKRFQCSFLELINFSDSSGIIGKEVCSKLYLDFKFHENQPKSPYLEYYYKTFKDAFEIAQNNGALVFSSLI